MDLHLANKAVLVTGASSGIGAAIARAFAAEQARVVVHYHTGRERAESLVETLGSGHCALGADLTNEEQVEDLFAQAEERVGPLHVLVANAGGWAGSYEDICGMELSRWKATIDQDLTSAFLTCRAFLRRVAKQGFGNIVLMGSHSGVFGEAGDTDYAAAKAGINYGLGPSLKTEIARLAPSGRVNVVAPGWTITPMVANFISDEDAVRGTLQVTSTRRLSTPEDIAPIVVFLASDHAAGQITGQVVIVNGGQEGRLLWSPEEAMQASGR